MGKLLEGFKNSFTYFDDIFEKRRETIGPMYYAEYFKSVWMSNLETQIIKDMIQHENVQNVETFL